MFWLKMGRRVRDILTHQNVFLSGDKLDLRLPPCGSDGYYVVHSSQRLHWEKQAHQSYNSIKGFF